MISLHNIAHIHATQSTLPGGNWTELHFVSGASEQTSLTLYFARPNDAKALADAVNTLFVSPDVIANINLTPSEPVE